MKEINNDIYGVYGLQLISYKSNALFLNFFELTKNYTD